MCPKVLTWIHVNHKWSDATLDNLTVLTCILHTLKSGILTRTCHLSRIVGRMRFWRKKTHIRGVHVLKGRILEGSDCIMFVFQGEYIVPRRSRCCTTGPRWWGRSSCTGTRSKATWWRSSSQTSWQCRPGQTARGYPLVSRISASGRTSTQRLLSR